MNRCYEIQITCSEKCVNLAKLTSSYVILGVLSLVIILGDAR